jgi:hypothetical protein
MLIAMDILLTLRMDTNILSTILGVAVGAVATSIPKIWDFFFESRKHKQAIQKEFFERKMNVLQAYVAVCTQLSASHFHNAISAEQLAGFSFFGEQDAMAALVLENLDKNANENRNSAKLLTEVSSAVSMFIDLKIDEEAAYSLIKSIHTDIARIGQFKGEVDKVIDKYQLENEPTIHSVEGKEYFQKKEHIKIIFRISQASMKESN